MNLVQRSVKSSAYNVGSSFIQTAIAFLRSMILLRLLSPETFGTYQFISSLILWTAALPNFGMGGALVHRTLESEGDKALRVHFTLNLIFNTIWGIGLVFLGSIFKQDDQSNWIFISLVVCQFTVNLTQTARSKLVRKVVFQRIALLNTLSTGFSAVIVVILAWQGFGVWSLVSGDLITAVILLVGLYVIRPVWRIRLGWAKDTVRYFLLFGYRNFLNQPLLRTLDRLDDLWTGYYLGNEALGFYSRAYRLASYPGNLLAMPLSSVATGTYAELKEKPKQLSQAFFRVNAFLIRTGFLIGGLLTLVAPEFISIVAGEQWLPMVNAFRLMLVFTLLNPIKLTVAGLFPAIGKPEIVLRTRLVQLGVLILTLFVFGPLWGIEGVALAVDIMLLSGILLLLWQAKKYVRCSFVQWFTVPSSALILGISIPIVISYTTGFEPASPWITLIAKSLSFLIIFIGILIGFEKEQLPMLLDILKKLSPPQKSQNKNNCL